jgi:hypothetical protein
MAGVPARAVARWSGVSFAPLPVGVEEGDRDRSSAPPVSRPVPSRAPASHHPVWMGHGGGEPDQPGEQTGGERVAAGRRQGEQDDDQAGGHGDVGWVRPRWPCGAAPTLSRWPLRRAGPARSPASEAPRCGPSSSAGLDQHRRGTPSGLRRRRGWRAGGGTSRGPSRRARWGRVGCASSSSGTTSADGRARQGAQRSDHLGAVV